MLSMNIRTEAEVSMDFLQAHHCALFVLWSTNVTMQSWPFSKVGRAVMMSMPIHCEWQLAMGSG